MRLIHAIAILALLSGCSKESTITSEQDIEKFFASVQSENGRPVALKKHSPGLDVTSYLLTIHGYADNMSVCNELIRLHSNSGAGEVVAGSFYCEQIEKEKAQ